MNLKRFQTLLSILVPRLWCQELNPRNRNRSKRMRLKNPEDFKTKNSPRTKERRQSCQLLHLLKNWLRALRQTILLQMDPRRNRKESPQMSSSSGSSRSKTTNSKRLVFNPKHYSLRSWPACLSKSSPPAPRPRSKSFPIVWPRALQTKALLFVPRPRLQVHPTPSSLR